MATYTELYGLHNDSDLRNRVAVACMVAAEAINNEDAGTDNHVNRLVWATQIFANPRAEAERMFWAILAANVGLAIEAIQGAADSAIQSQVDTHVDLFATGV